MKKPGDVYEENKNELNEVEESVYEPELDIELKDVDGNMNTFSFIYKDETYKAIYTDDNWKIIDSYKIRNKKDIIKICQRLTDVHPIHGKDMISYRTADDLAYEWIQHNIAYDILPNDNKWKLNAKDVDFNPEDQGRNIIELYESRTREEFNDNNIDVEIKKDIKQNKDE